MDLRDHHRSCKFYSISAFHHFQSTHVLTHTSVARRTFFSHYSLLCHVRLHMGQGDDHRSCKLYFIFVSFSFGICHILTFLWKRRTCILSMFHVSFLTNRALAGLFVC